MVDQPNVKYVPALKWRKGEKVALKNLSARLKDAVIPLIELVNDEGDNPDDLSKDLALYWGKTAYLDVHYRPGHFARTALDNVAQHMNGIDIIPVVRLDSSQIIIDGVKSVAGMYNNGLAVRIVITANLDFNLLQKEVDLVVGQLSSISKDKIDIIVDFGHIDKNVAYKSTLEQIKNNLDLSDWRRIIIAAGTFPPNLLSFRPNEDNFLNRSELELWEENKLVIGRESIYSDYTVRYPSNITKGGRGSKSVRYTLKDKFQVFRGTLEDGTFKYLVHAANIRALYEDTYPENYSWGDEFIKQKADQLEECLQAGIDPETYTEFSTGGSTEWVAASVNHHMSVVLNSNLKG